MKAEELAPLLAPNTGPDNELHAGTITFWDDTTGANKVEWGGTVLENLPVLASAGLTALTPGTTVILQKWKSTFLILGRVVQQASGLASPQFPIVMYAMFQQADAPNTPGYATLDAGVLANWEGRARVSYPAITFDGVWGVATGTGSITYQAKVAGNVIGSWTHTGLNVSRKGPFRVDEFIGQDWLMIEVAISSSSGTGLRAFQILGAYFQQITT